MMDSAIVLKNNDFESSKEDCCLSAVLAGEPSSIKRLHINDVSTQKLFLQQLSVLQKSIPKQIMTLEEKYIRHCLELIRMSSMRENVNFFPDRFGSRVVGGDRDTMLLFSPRDENVVVSPPVNPIVGSITGSASMLNLINSTLLRRLGSSENSNINYENPSVTEVTDIPTKTIVSGDQVFRHDPVHNRVVSFSSTNSTSSSSTSSSSSSSVYNHGMLHCSWNNGSPRYVFSVEDQREVYTTNLLKTDSGYIYMFYSKNNHDESDLVGKMRVSTSFTLCPLGTEVMETEFILSATSTGQHNEHHNETGMNTPNHPVKKSTGLTKKVASILRGSHTYRQRTASKFDGSSGHQDMLQSHEEPNLFPANLELAAVAVKDHIPCKKVEVGGWGLKFLKEQKAAALVTQSVACEACRHNSDHHSVSMDVVVPAGVHGGPRTKHGGPSSLVQRWRSGGACDCGGWDVGCPIIVLSSGPNNKEALYQDGVFGKSNRFELFTQGSVPVIEVANVHDGLYYIHYQSTLSALQSLSVAVAIIHSHSPTLKPRLYRK